MHAHKALREYGKKIKWNFWCKDLNKSKEYLGFDESTSWTTALMMTAPFNKVINDINEVYLQALKFITEQNEFHWQQIYLQDQ